jgi:hypothetical protein
VTASGGQRRGLLACPALSALPGRAISRGAAVLGASAGAFLLVAWGATSVAQAAESTLQASDVTLAPAPSAGPTALLDGGPTGRGTPDGDTAVRQTDGATTRLVPQATESTAPAVNPAEALGSAVPQAPEAADPDAENLAPVVRQVHGAATTVLEQAETLVPAVGEVAETAAPVLEQAETLVPAVGEVAETAAPVLEQAETLVPAVQQPADDDALDASPAVEEDGRGDVVLRTPTGSPASPGAETAHTGCPVDTASGPLFVACRSHPGDAPGGKQSPAWPEMPLPAGTVSPVTPPSGGAPSQSPAGSAPGVPPSTTSGGGTSNASPEATVDAAATGLSARGPPTAEQVSGGPRQRERVPPTTPD